jgi:hypothetical protein
VGRRSHSPARRRCRNQLADRTRQAAVGARNCNSARARAEVQSYRYRRSRAEQFQTRMRTPPMLSVQVFLPCRFPLLSGGLNPAITAKLPKKMTAVQITQRLNEKDDSRRRAGPRYTWNFPGRALRTPCVNLEKSMVGRNRCGATTRPANFRDSPIFYPTAIGTHRTLCLSFDRWERNEKRRSKPHNVVR